MKQTAVEWLVEQLFGGNNGVIGVSDFLLNQSKEMEKQHIIDAWIDGKENKEFGNTVFEDAKQYYNEKFKKKPAQ
jgi:hypothetical protein